MELGAEMKARPSGLVLYASGTVKDACVSFDALHARLVALPHQKLPSTFWQALHRFHIILKALEPPFTTTIPSASAPRPSISVTAGPTPTRLVVRIPAATVPQIKRSRFKSPRALGQPRTSSGRVDWRAVAQLETIANISPATPGEQLARALHLFGDPAFQNKFGSFVCDVINPSRLEQLSAARDDDLTSVGGQAGESGGRPSLDAWTDREQAAKSELIRLCRRVHSLQDREMSIRYQRCLEGMRLVQTQDDFQKGLGLPTEGRTVSGELDDREWVRGHLQTRCRLRCRVGFRQVSSVSPHMLPYPVSDTSFATHPFPLPPSRTGCPYVFLVLFFVTDGFTIDNTISLGSAMEGLVAGSTPPKDGRAGNAATKKWSTDYAYLQNGLRYLQATVLTLRTLAPPIPVTWQGEDVLLSDDSYGKWKSQQTIYSVGGSCLSGHWAAKKHISNPDVLFSSLRTEKMAMSLADAARCLGKPRGLGVVPLVNETTDDALLPRIEATDLGMQLLSTSSGANEARNNGTAITTLTNSRSRQDFLRFSQGIVDGAISSAPFDHFASIDAAMDCVRRLDVADPDTLCESLNIEALQCTDTSLGPSSKRGALRQVCMALGAPAEDWETDSKAAELESHGPQHGASVPSASRLDIDIDGETLRRGQDRLRLLLAEEEAMGNIEDISTLRDFEAMHGRLGRSGGKKFRIKREFIEQYGAIIRDPLNPKEPLIVLHPAKVFPEAVKRSVESSIRDDLFFPPGPMRMERELRLERGEQAQASCMIGLQLRYAKAPYVIKSAKDLGPVGGAVLAALHPVISYLDDSLKATSPEAHATLETTQALARASLDNVPRFQTNVAINWESVIGAHIDPDVSRAMCSLFVGGSFEGKPFARGELCFHELGLIIECGDGLAVHFQSSRLIHSSFPFSGSRYSVVFFTSQEFASKVAAGRSADAWNGLRVDFDGDSFTS
ncbi:BQ5605_C039g11828 [Microbotryum silenes-dioicae]|uniref:BQ5605_C039g11828 protein n=1 Tax=Microbotryum silenes-dioicae TaxID=796604 RepID=A0A2X0MEY1_9BASI|nr:BQ5605_C039g11828 [Microbotryum silenes-dioicae]